MARTIEIDEGPDLPDWQAVIERRSGVVSVREFDGSLVEFLKGQLLHAQDTERQLRTLLTDVIGKLATVQTALPEFSFDLPEIPAPQLNFHERAFHVDARTSIAEGAIKSGDVHVPPIPAPQVTVELHDAPDSDS